MTPQAHKSSSHAPANITQARRIARALATAEQPQSVPVPTVTPGARLQTPRPEVEDSARLVTFYERQIIEHREEIERHESAIEQLGLLIQIESKGTGKIG